MTDILMSKYTLTMVKGASLAMVIVNMLALAGELHTGWLYFGIALVVYTTAWGVEPIFEESGVDNDW